MAADLNFETNSYLIFSMYLPMRFNAFIDTLEVRRVP